MIPILYEDPSLVVCVKPVGLQSQQAQEQSLPRVLAEQLHCPIFPVHRLDLQVGGVMVYAKTEEAAARLTRAMADGQLRKTYLAVVTGHMEQPAGELSDLLYHDRVKNKTYVVKRSRAGVKQARLAYTVLAEKEDCSLVRVQLFTGRTHQIRVQFASRGHSLLGDGKYGSKNNRCTAALWAYALQLPVGKEPAVFSFPPPDQYPWCEFSLETE